jgi:pyridoxal biosynthesis lyase PdxS
MSMLSEIGSLLSGQEGQRLAAGQGNFQNADSPDMQRVQQMFSQLNPQQQQQVMSQAAQQMNPQQYADHMSSGGSSPLANLSSGGLRTIASTLLQHLGAGGVAGSLLSRIPGLQTTDPSQMDHNQVAALAQYTQQNHPDIFGRAAAQLGQQQPDLLHSFLGKAGLAIGAAALASHFMGQQQH